MQPTPRFAMGDLCRTIVSTQAGDVHILVKYVGHLPTMKHASLVVVADAQTGQEYVLEEHRLEPYQP